MVDGLVNAISLLASYQAHWILLALAVLLIVIDYAFPTDAAAHWGYVCFALSFFFMLPLPLLTCLLAAVGAWIALEVVHHFFLRTILQNTPKTGD